MTEPQTPGVHVETTVTLDWADLGTHLSTRSSDVQARFLLEFAHALRMLPGIAGPMQVAYIRDVIRSYETQDRATVSWLLNELTGGSDD